MWVYPTAYDVIVVGAGHAGCEAAHVCAKMGTNVLLVTSNLDGIGKMSCNPAIGGVAKGHIVREIDALGGIMGVVADGSGIQFRMLNRTKGPAVHSPRAQSDKSIYHSLMKNILENTPRLHLLQASVEDLYFENDCISGVVTRENVIYKSQIVILSVGTFMQGLIHIGHLNYSGGRAGDPSFSGISSILARLGFTISRLKTGTPPRILASSVNFSVMEEQPGEEGVCFSHYTKPFIPSLKQVSCYLTHTTEKTKCIIERNLEKSALYGGRITGTGPRYCPSIEDKIVKFSDKSRHHIFLEPEGLQTQEIYINGLSTSLPCETQLDLVRSVEGMEQAVITRPAYAIEYDFVSGNHIRPSLETKIIENLFLCGQINGTTGYEEAAGQGLIAGINAVLKIKKQAPFIPKRHESYLGVMIDDLTTQILDEPYRMFTSRSEYRLLLRQDNACERLSGYAYELGLISQQKYSAVQEKQTLVTNELNRLRKIFKKEDKNTVSLFKILSRPECSYSQLLESYPEDVIDFTKDLRTIIETEIKYSGYIDRQKITIANLTKAESTRIPEDFNYETTLGLSLEAREKFFKFQPTTIGAASRISGIASADVQILIIALKKYASS
ncbi:MAG: tRNA uridine-5-carboxymethylaminomethyl(34) synthesis enzyme MnmG [Victivallaceae bacterium]